MLQYNQTHCSVYRTSRQELHCIHIHHHGGECYSIITHCSVYRTSRQELHCIHIHHHGGECYSIMRLTVQFIEPADGNYIVFIFIIMEVSVTV